MKKMSEIERGLLDAIRDMKQGRAAKIHSVAELSARRRGRPPLAMTKIAVKLRLDADLLSTLRESGEGWQTRVNGALRRAFMAPEPNAVTFTLVAENDHHDFISASSTGISGESLPVYLAVKSGSKSAYVH